MDVGAYIGVYSVVAAQATNGRVLAFEPHPGAREQLERNLRLNGSDVIVIAGAAGAGTCEAVLHVAAGGAPRGRRWPTTNASVHRTPKSPCRSAPWVFNRVRP